MIGLESVLTNNSTQEAANRPGSAFYCNGVGYRGDCHLSTALKVYVKLADVDAEVDEWQFNKKASSIMVSKGGTCTLFSGKDRPWEDEANDLGTDMFIDLANLAWHRDWTNWDNRFRA